MYDFYIAPEEYKKAKQNGICKKTLESRIRSYGWNKKKALGQPVRKSKNKFTKEIIELANKNGVSYILLKDRVLKGWSIRKAATTKVIKPSGRPFKYGKEVYKKLEENNINIHTFYARVNRQGWSIERACTQKTMTTKEVTDNLKTINDKNPNWFCKINMNFKNKGKYKIVERSNVIQYDDMGNPLRLVINNYGRTLWIDTLRMDGDVVLKWRNKHEEN